MYIAATGGGFRLGVAPLRVHGTGTVNRPLWEVINILRFDSF